jgi:hypothetical protein
MQARNDNLERKNLLASGLSMVGRNKRYIVWFFLLNLTLGFFGTAAFSNQAHNVLDNSLYSERLLHGFHTAALTELFMRPEFGPMKAASASAFFFIFVFFLATAVFLPGVFQGFASKYRLPREDFFRACGRNLWRFVRLLIIAGIVMGIVAGALFAAQGALIKKAGESTNELLPFDIQMVTLAIIFLIMCALRIWFDLAETDTVLSDQNAVRKSIGAAWRHTFRALGRLLGSYVITTIVAAAILIAGLLSWMKFVAPENILGAFIVSQVTLLLLLIPRFWQRGVVVAYWQQAMVAPVVSVEPATTMAAPAPASETVASAVAPVSSVIPSSDTPSI